MLRDTEQRLAGNYPSHLSPGTQYSHLSPELRWHSGYSLFGINTSSDNLRQAGEVHWCSVVTEWLDCSSVPVSWPCSGKTVFIDS